MGELIQVITAFSLNHLYHSFDNVIIVMLGTASVLYAIGKKNVQMYYI